MSRAPRGTIAGFSLVELMVVVAVVAILTAIAYPAYRRYALQSDRTDAIRALTSNAQILQRCYSQTFTFNSATCTGLATTSPNDYYTIVNTVNASTYSLTATAANAQTADTTCNSFTLTQTGQESALDSSNNDQTTTCWGGN